MNKIIKVILGTVVLLAVSQAGNLVNADIENLLVNKSTEEDIVRSIIKLNEQLPMIIDDNTTITEVLVENSVITKKYRLHYNLLQSDYTFNDLDKLKKIEKITVLFSACQDLSFYFEHDLDVQYEYSLLNGLELFQFQISKRDCLPFLEDDSRKVARYYIELHRQLVPMKLNSETFLVDAKYSHDSIEFTYQFVDFSKDEMDVNAFKEFIQTASPQENCLEADMKIFFEMAFSIRETYLDRNGTFIYSFETTKDMC